MDDRSPEVARETQPDVGLRELARVLVRGSAEADDLAQDAWIVLARKNALAPEERWPLAFGVLRNLARSRNRRERHRRFVERGSARPESVESTQADLERHEIARRIVAQVRTLDEPYRSVVELRYLEELTAEEVARRLDRPAATVRSQTQRGLVLLRERLDREDPGGRRAWCASLALLDVGRPRPLGRSLAIRQWLIGGAAIVGLAFVAQRLLRADGSVDSPPIAALDSKARVPDSLQPANDAPSRRPIGALEMVLESGPAAHPAFDAGPATSAEYVDVLTVDANGQSAAEVDVFVVAGGITRHAGRSSASGRLRFPFTSADLSSEISVLAPSQLALVAEDRARATSLLVFVERRRALADVVRIPLDRGGVILSGSVLDPAGFPIAGAIVEYGETIVRRTELEPGIARHDTSAPQRTDDAGQFTMRVDPGRARLRARAPDRPETMFAVIADESSPHACTLRFSRGHDLAGVVLAASGEPAVGARVFVDPGETRLRHEVTTDSDGRFILRDVQLGARIVWAIHRAESASMDLDARAGGASEWNPRLANRPALRVRLVDESGAPRAGYAVSVRTLGTSPYWQRGMRTDEEGRAAAVDVPEGLVEILVAPLQRSVPYPMLVRRLESIGADEVELVLASADVGVGVLRGTVVDSAGRPLDLRLGVLIRKTGNTLTNEVPVDASSGAFRIDSLPSGDYEALLVLRSTEVGQVGCVDLRTLTLRASEESELGPLALPRPGFLALIADPIDESATLEIAALTDLFGRVTLLTGRGRIPERIELLPGDYAVCVRIRERVVVEGSTRVESGSTVHLVLAPPALGR